MARLLGIMVLKRLLGRSAVWNYGAVKKAVECLTDLVIKILFVAKNCFAKIQIKCYSPCVKKIN